MRNLYTSGWNNSDVEKPADHFSELQNQFQNCKMETRKRLVPGNQLRKVIQALPEDIRDSILKAVFPQ